jgi:hypothetical protein
MGTNPPTVVTRSTTSSGPVGWEMEPAGRVVVDDPGAVVGVVSGVEVGVEADVDVEPPPAGGESIVPQAAAARARMRTRSAARDENTTE